MAEKYSIYPINGLFRDAWHLVELNPIEEGPNEIIGTLYMDELTASVVVDALEAHETPRIETDSIDDQVYALVVEAGKIAQLTRELLGKARDLEGRIVRHHDTQMGYPGTIDGRTRR